MRDDEFEWDDRKARANLKKHNISFEDARLAFLDTMGQEELDDRENYGEERSIRIGMANSVLLAVTFTARGHRIRIISARRATKREQTDYDNQFT
jgi:uncharacterized protein